MKQLFTVGVCLVLMAANQFAEAQNCKAGNISVLKDTICQGTSVSLTVTSSNGNIQWQLATRDTFVNIKGATDTSLRIAPLLQTTYFRVVVSNGTCSDTSLAIKVFVPAPVQPFFSTSQSGLYMITFNSDSSVGDIARYHWDFGDGDTSDMLVANPTRNYAKDTTYYICLTVYDSFACSYTFCRYVDVYGSSQPPCYSSFSFSYSDNTVYFNASVPGQRNYTWAFGDGTGAFDGGLNAAHRYDSSGTYLACLSVEFDPGYWCGTCDTISVIVNAIKSVSANNQTLIVYPNPCTNCEIKGIENSNELLVTNLLGRVVPVTFSKQSNGYLINFSSGGRGMYLVKNITTGEVVKVVRE